jgi:hypothetical protein
LAARIPPRSAQATPELIDLSAFYNAALGDNWHNSWQLGNNLAILPSGLQTLAGTKFDVRGIVQLSSRGLFGTYPGRVAAIPVNLQCRQLCFLHSAGYGFKDPDGTLIGRYLVHFVDGQTREIPIVLGWDVRDWRLPGQKAQTTRSIVAWRPGAPDNRNLYKSTWTNPLPNLKIVNLDFESCQAFPAPFLIAMTAQQSETSAPPVASVEASPDERFLKRDALAPAELIDLSVFFNAALVDRWSVAPNTSVVAHLGDLPRGVQTFAGTQFDIRGVIQLSSKNLVERGLKFPDAVESILVGRACRRLQFLQGAVAGEREKEGALLGKYVIHLANGERAELPVVFGLDVRDWRMTLDPQARRAVLACQLQDVGGELLLYKSTWTNTLPNTSVERVDFVSAQADAGPFLLAITAE